MRLLITLLVAGLISWMQEIPGTTLAKKDLPISVVTQVPMMGNSDLSTLEALKCIYLPKNALRESIELPVQCSFARPKFCLIRKSLHPV